MINTKQIVGATRSIFAFVLGFQQFGYVAIMLDSGINGAQIALLLSLNVLFTIIFLFLVLVRSHFKHAMTISYLVSAQVFLVLLLYPHLYGFLVNSVLIGFSNATFASIIIQVAGFTKKEMSWYMTLSLLLSGSGVAYFYLSSKIPIDYLIVGLYIIMLINSLIASKVPITSKDINLKESVKTIVKAPLLVTIFGGSFRRVVLTNLLPVIIYEILRVGLLSVTPYYVLLTVLPLPFLFFSYKLSNKAFLGVSFIVGVLVIFLGEAKTLLPLIALLVGLKALYALRGPVAEYAIIHYVRGSTRVFSGIELINNLFTFSITVILSAVIYLGDYFALFIFLFFIEVIDGIVIYKILREVEIRENSEKNTQASG